MPGLVEITSARISARSAAEEQHLSTTSAGTPLAVHIAFAAAVLGLCVLRWWLGLAGTRYCTHDGFMALDGAWRMLHGQRPHIDFNSMVGPVAYWPLEAGLRITGNASSGFGLAQSFMGALLAVWSYLLARRLAWAPRVALALAILAVTISPSQLGLSPTMLNPGGTYNRYGYGLFGLFLLESFAQRGRPRFLDGLSTGVVLVLMLFLKITFAIVSVPLLVAFLFLCPQSRERILGLICGAAIPLTICLVYLRFQLGGILRDLALTAGAKHVHLLDFYIYDTIFLEAGVTLAIAFGVAIWLKERGLTRESRRIRLGSVLIVLTSLLLIFGNWQQSELPAAAFLMLFLIDAMLSSNPERQDARSLGWTVNAAGFAYAGVLIGSLLAGLVTQTRLKLHSVPKGVHFKSAYLDGFVPIGDDTSYILFVNDGLDLLASERRTGEHVFSLDFVNPFSIALQIPPAEGGTTNLQFQGSFDNLHHVPAEKLFGQSELVMLPTTYSDSSLTLSVPLIYGPYLRQHYQRVGQSKFWELWRRSGPGPSL